VGAVREALGLTAAGTDSRHASRRNTVKDLRGVPAFRLVTTSFSGDDVVTLCGSCCRSWVVARADLIGQPDQSRFK
jgi:hypothetical protein